MATLYNRIAGGDGYQQTHLSGKRHSGGPAVAIYLKRGVRTDRSMCSAVMGADALLYRNVDAEGRDYISPHLFALMDAGCAWWYWTLSPGNDRLFIDDFPAGTSLADALKTGDGFLIKGVNAFDQLGERTAHWEVYA